MNRLSNFAITEIIGVYTPTYFKKEILPMSNRLNYGLSLAISGEIAYTHNGKTYISNKNNMIFLPKGASYELNCYKPGQFTLINFLCDENFKCDEFLQIPITDHEGFIHIHRIMTELFLFKTPSRNFELMSLAYSMLSKLHTNITNQKPYPIIQTGMRYMEENLHNPNLSNNDIANSAGVSEIYFRKLFKKNFGTTPHNYIQQIRINKAKSLLEDGIVSIDEISSNCGFNNIYYFLRVFKEKTGYTPTEYREKYYKKHL